MRRRMLLIAGISMIAMVGTAARAQSAGAAAAAGAANKAQGAEVTTNSGQQANYAIVESHQRGGIGFTGKVVVQDAMFPWDPIPVIVTCDGVVRARTNADAKGNFTLGSAGIADPMHSEIGAEPGSSKKTSASQLIGCDAQGSMAGFKSTTVHIANLNIMDNPDIGTITMRPDNSAAGSATSATTTTASAEALKRFNKARAEYQTNNIDGAQRDLEKAVQIDPKFADAWYQLGKLQQAKNNPDALGSYQKAVADDPRFVSPYEHIAEEAAMQKKWQDVVNATDAELKLDPEGSPQVWYFNALGNLNMGKPDTAEASARKALAMDPQHTAPNTEQLLAVILAGKGELGEALKHLQNSLTYVKPGPNADMIKQQIAQLEKALPPGSN
jgi:tetratricopeptide (TPR) repeat protein